MRFGTTLKSLPTNVSYLAIEYSENPVRSEGEMVAEFMSVNLYRAAINGTMMMPTVAGEHQQLGVMMAMGNQQIDQAELQHVTRSRDTLLHLLVTNRHNDIAFSVFESDTSLLGAENMMLETPLHCAAKVGNRDFICRLKVSHHLTDKEVFRKRNKEGDTAMHVAAKHGRTYLGLDLMELDSEVAYIVNNDKLFPLNIAIIKENLEMVQEMLKLDCKLASTPFANGMFPVHVAARMAQTEMVMHFINNYPDEAKLLDPRGRNFFHIAAEEGRNDVFRDILKGPYVREVLTTMNDATDYEENSMLHVAAMKGHLSLMKDIWEKYNGQDGKKNTHGLTPIDLYVRQLRATTKVGDSLARTIDQQRLSDEWFNNAMQLSLQNQWDITQVIGLGSVLIITVTFAAAFTIPGGYNQNNGTPLLGRIYMFRAFIIANNFAFIYGFLSLYILLKGAMEGQPGLALLFAIDTFLLAACSMFIAFGLGMYVMLASVRKPVALTVFVSMLLINIVSNINVRRKNRRIGLAFYAGTILVIFGLAIV